MIPPPLRAGEKKERLPDEENVIRLLKKTSHDGRVPPDEFVPTSKDEASELQSLSVWAERLTSPEQARAFMEHNQEAYALYFSLNVDNIRALRPVPDDVEGIPSLDVVWDPRTIIQDGVEVPDPRPGAEGHAGITGLVRPPKIPRAYFFSLRSQLTDLANQTLREISD